MLKFLNGHIGELITRQQLLKSYSIQLEENTWTLDVYRMYLTKAGYLKSFKLGHYKVLKKIPDISVRKCRYQAYGK